MIAFPCYAHIELAPHPVSPFLRPIPNLSRYFPANSASLVLHRDVESTILPHPLELHYCPTSYSLDTNFSACIRFIVYRHLPSDPIQANTRRWPGTVVVLKYSDTLCSDYTDVDANDLRYVQTYFVRRFAATD